MEKLVAEILLWKENVSVRPSAVIILSFDSLSFLLKKGNIGTCLLTYSFLVCVYYFLFLW